MWRGEGKVTQENRFSFIGVTTGKSAIMRVFPEWARYLGLKHVRIVGYDLPIHAPAETYRSLVERLKRDPVELGGLVTTHKIDLFHACRDLFDYIDPFAELCHEVSCLSKDDGSFCVHAKDPISAGKSLDLILDDGYWGRTGGHCLCLGAGGSAIAITLHLMTREADEDRPQRIVVVNRSEPRLRAMAKVHRQMGTPVSVEYVCSADPVANDELVSLLPAGSLVINATGRGKDSPGSPITDAAVFPEGGIAWELNYRGELDFLHQAWRQVEPRGLAVHDGWEYFVFGWTAVLDEVFKLSLTDGQLRELSTIAKANR